MSEADARGSPSPASTRAASPSDPPQDAVEREGEKGRELSLSEEIYSTLDSVLGDIHVGHGSPEAGAWPVSTHSAPAHQYGHLCELHRRRASPEETVTLQPVADDSPYAGGPGHDDSTGRPGEHCSSKDAGPEPGSTRAGGNLLARPSAWQLPRNRPWAHSCGDSPEAGPPPARPCGHLRKVTDCSQEVPSPRAGAGRATGQPQEAVDGGRESSRGPGTWSPAGTSCSGGSDSEGSEEGLALNEALRQLRAANREQQAQIRSLRSSNARLESKVRELQAGAAKQRLLAGAIGTLRENVEALIEDKYRAMLEKHELDHALRDLHRVLAGTQTHLRESLSDKETLELELRKVQASYVHLQEKYVAELRPDEPPRPGGQRAEAEPLRQLRGELERAASCTQRLLQGERRARERELLALQEALRQHQREDLEERERVQARLERLGAQVRGLACGKEPARGGGLPEQAGPGTPQLPGSQSQRAPEPPEEPETALDTVQDSEQPTELPLDPSPGQEGSPGSPDSRRASQLAAKVHSVLGLMVGLLSRQGHSPLDADGAAQPPDSEGVGESLVQKLGHLQLKKERLEKELLRHKQRIATFGKSVASSKAAQRRAQSTVTSDQSAPPPVLQGTGRDGSGHGCPQPPATDPGPADTRSVVEVPVLLDTKLDEYHLLNQELGSVVTKLGGLLESKENHCHRLLEENDKYQRHLGSLIDQVASYEEIIQCADQRLAVSCSHITHLEERNRHLEDLIRRPGKQARKLRLRGLEAQPGLAGRAGSRDGHCPEGPAPV